MVVSVSLGLAQTNTVDDRSVVQLVRDHSVLSVEQSLEETSVGIETRGVQNAILHSVELGNQVLQLLVHIGGSANETHRGESESMGIQSLLGSLDQIGTVGETQVVVGAEVQDLLVASLDGDLSSLLASNHTLLLEGSGGADIVQRLVNSLVQLSSVLGDRQSFSHCS